MCEKLYTPTIGELIEELNKYDSNCKIWIDADGKRFTPIYVVDYKGSYTMEIMEGSFENTVYIRLRN